MLPVGAFLHSFPRPVLTGPGPEKVTTTAHAPLPLESYSKQPFKIKVIWQVIKKNL